MVIVAAEMGGQKWGDYVHDNFFTSLVPYVPVFIGLFLVGHWLEKRKKEKIPCKNVKNSKWIKLLMVLMLMAGTAGALTWLRVNQKLGAPGIKGTPVSGRSVK